MVTPVILAGGSGTRLWPLSRKSYPKQFTQIIGEKSLFQTAISRVTDMALGTPIILTNNDFRFIVAEQLEQEGIKAAQIMIEPEARNTAPAILAAALAKENKPDEILLVMPSDHIIEDEQKFKKALATATKAAERGEIVAFGIEPEHPESGYGYLLLDEKISAYNTSAIRLRSFVEKPDAKSAKRLIAKGNCLWNAGIFMARVDTFISAFETCAPRLLMPCRAAVSLAKKDNYFTQINADAWSRCENISMDYAVMEIAEAVTVVPFNGGWCDLGSWQSVYSRSTKDAQGNAVYGDACALGCKNSLLRSDDPNMRLVGLGLDGIIAIAMGDAVLVSKIEESQKVKEVISELKTDGAKQAEEFNRVHRPWGFYETLSLGHRFQVKRIKVKPGASLSLQSHVHRAEHWVVVEGSANVTIDDDVKLIAENQSVYIPLGAIHRLHNPGKVPLQLVEVQSGSYLGEDDIFRYEDDYQRHEQAI